MKKHFFIHTFLLSIIFFSLTSFFAHSQTFISGKVVSENGSPLKDVTVSIDNGRAVITSTSGVFGVEIKGTKPTSVVATKPNLKMKGDWSYDEKEKKLKIIMLPLGSIQGTLRDDKNRPLANAKIILSKINPNKPALTNTEGQFNIALSEGADVTQAGDLFINEKQMPEGSFSIEDGSLKIDGKAVSKSKAQPVIQNSAVLEQAKILETKKVNKVKVVDSGGNPLQKQKIRVDQREYFTNNEGEVIVNHDLHKDTKLSIEGFKMHILPTEAYLLVRVEIMANDEEADTSQVISDIINESATIETSGDYKEKFNKIIADLEVQKQMLVQFSEQTRFEIEEITTQLLNDKNISPAEKKELASRRTVLEQMLVENELKYQDAINQTKVALDSMRSVLTAKDELSTVQQEEIEREKGEGNRNAIIFAVIALSLVIVTTTFFITNKRVKKEHDELERTSAALAASLNDVTIAKNETEQKNNQILTSIRYAETMQKAILPLDDTFNKHFTEHCKIYIPKDIVSGDFYWCLPLEHHIFLALVDCTGHGVPGAFMSLIGNNSLNEIITQKKVQEPALILEELNLSIRKALRQEFTDNDDGMDIALCCISKPNEKGNVKVTFAGAKRNMLYYSRLVGTDLVELKGDKKTIGGFFKENKITRFTNHEVELKKGDSIYMFTDGLSDQSNEDGEKFGSIRLKELLKDHVNLSLAEQQIILLEELKIFQRNAAQRDDITLIGIRI